MASLLLGDPMADLAEPRVSVKAVLMGQETKRSPEPALLTDEGQPFATRIIFLKSEGGKLLAVNLKNPSRPCQLTWMVSQNGVILVTGPDPILHVGDTLPPKPPAFVAYLEAGERHSSKMHQKAPQLLRDIPAQQGRPSGSHHHSWTCPGDSLSIPCSLSPPSAPKFLYLSNPPAHAESNGFVPPCPLAKPGETWCNPMGIKAPTLLPAANLDHSCSANLDHGCSAHLQAVISIHHPAVGARGKEQEDG